MPVQLSFEKPPKYQITEVPINMIELPKVFGRDKTRLAQNIVKMGVLQAPGLFVNDKGGYNVIYGGRRIVNALGAGYTHLECRVYEDVDIHQIRAMQLVENCNRSQNWPQMVLALRGLLDAGGGMTIDEISQALNISKQQLKIFLSLAQLPEELIEEMVNGKLTQSQARTITKLSPAQQAELANQAANGTKITKELIKEKRVAHHSLVHQSSYEALSNQMSLFEPESDVIQPELDYQSLETVLRGLESHIAANPGRGANQVKLAIQIIRQNIEFL
jgi:ParB/RepB/Spo0J family partition protein